MDSEQKKRKLDDSCSVSSTSSESSESSSSSDDERQHKKAKSSKKKDKKKDSKKKKKKDSKKKKKKKKKDKKKSEPDADERIRQSKTGSSTGIFGMYGVIGQSDKYSKETEFHTYLREVKKEEPTMMSRRDEDEFYKDFCEDYNTATMPSEKYYDMRKWEVQQRAKAEKQRKKMADDPNNVRTVFDDEEARRREYAKEDEQKRHRRTAEELMAMNREKVGDMKRQDQLKREMTLHYQTNNMQEVDRIKKLLGPDNPEGLSWFDPD